jgi:hypothetical protein
VVSMLTSPKKKGGFRIFSPQFNFIHARIRKGLCDINRGLCINLFRAPVLVFEISGLKQRSLKLVRLRRRCSQRKYVT